MKPFVLSLALMLATSLTAPAQQSLESGLLRQAPKLIKFCKEQGYKNVGVLKFLVSRAGQSFSDNVGTLNMLAARRLEMALVLANDPRAPIGVIQDASEVARKLDGASHLNKTGREKLFTGTYPLAWGKNTVKADAFFTGTAEISKDLKKVTLSLFAFDKSNNKLTPVGEDFTVANAVDRLSEIGESFVLRGTFDGGGAETTQAKKEERIYEEAAKVVTTANYHPAQQTASPVTLEVFYDNKKIPLNFKEGKAFISEPNEGQSVYFSLSRDASKERYGVVLKVNGENTLDKQRLPDRSCRMWVLEPKGGPWSIQGYHLGNNIREKFRVASYIESKQREVNYGHDVGTITLTVSELKKKPAPKLEDDDAVNEKVVAKLTQFSERPTNYGALKAKLLDDANSDDTRGGLIMEGTRETVKTETTKFTADPTPVMSWTIVYYRK